MKITILTLFPEMYEGFLHTSIISRILEKGLAEIRIVDIRDYSFDKHRHVDDTPYGGGAGMLMRVDVVNAALQANKSTDSYVLLTSPKAKPFKQNMAHRLLQKDDIVIICGHYEGIDERINDYVDENISIGDYILTGGELPSMVICDCLLRLLDDGISKDSLKEESYDNNLLEYPQYTRPYEYEGKKVPDVLINGNHKLIREYNLKKSLEDTLKYRPDLLNEHDFTPEETKMMEEIKDELEREN